MKRAAEIYISYIKNLVDTIEREQLTGIKQASDLLTKAIISGHTIWAFGCTHSAVLTAEIYYRAGGLALINGIFAPGMWLNEFPVTKTSKIENLSGYAKIILEEHGVSTGDILLLFSNSGRTVVSIEMAREAKKMGVKIIAITAFKYYGGAKNSSTQGESLIDTADITLDNGAEVGDAVVKLEGLEQKVGPVSTVGGVILLNSIICQTVENLLEYGIKPPVFLSGNIEGGFDHNKEMLKEYKNVIKYLL